MLQLATGRLIARPTYDISGRLLLPGAIGNTELISPGAGIDPAAAAFFAAANITDATQKTAVNGLVIALKAASIWAKIELLYPFVGGAATPHSFNLKDPTYKQITWAGGLTHDANGVTGNGVDGWGDTGWASASATIATQNSVSLFAYCRTESPLDATRFLGVSNNAGSSRIGMARVGTLLNGDGPHDGTSAASPSINTITPDFRGTMCVSRTAAAVKDLYIRGLTDGDTTASTGTCAGLLAILARNFEGFGADSFSDANLALVGAGGGLSAADYANLNTAIKQFELTLGRNVAD